MRPLILLFLATHLLLACNSEPQVAQSSPEEAAKGLFDALKASDFEKAKLFGTTATQKSLQDFEANLKMVSDSEKAPLLAPFQMNVSKVTCTDVQGTTNCTLCCSTEGDVILEMVQQDGKWFVQMEFAF